MINQNPVFTSSKKLSMINVTGMSDKSVECAYRCLSLRIDELVKLRDKLRARDFEQSVIDAVGMQLQSVIAARNEFKYVFGIDDVDFIY